MIQLELPLWPRALCKMNGMLVIAEFTPREGRNKITNKNKCPMPDCSGINLREIDGWIECDECGFAILKSDYEKIEGGK